MSGEQWAEKTKDRTLTQNSELRTENSGQFFHTWKNDKAKTPAFLDDYAFLIQAILQLQEITADISWLTKSKEITEFVIQNFSEDETGFFFFTGLEQDDVILRKKEVHDGALPSGNAVMLTNLYYLSLIFDLPPWKQRAEKVIASLGQAITGFPGSFGVWACLFQEIIDGTQEIVVVGENYSQLVKPVLAEYIPHKVFIASPGSSVELPLLAGKGAANPALIYLCRDYSCLEPVTDVTGLLKLLSIRNKN